MSAGAAVEALKAHLVDLQMPGGLEVVDSLLERLDHGAISPVVGFTGRDMQTGKKNK